jgi:hypothetical protein
MANTAALLVAAVRRPDLEELRPIVGYLLVAGREGATGKALASELDCRVWVGGEIQGPRGRTRLAKVLAGDYQSSPVS